MAERCGQFDVVVIGGGPGGIAAAGEAARLGGTVALVEADHLGGRANWHSLLPSKVWLTAADRLGMRRHDGELGLEPASEGADIPAITARIATLSRINGARYRDELSALGVDLIEGRAVFVDPHTVQLEDRAVQGDRFIVATGSGPIFFPELKPDGERIIAPRHMGKLPKVPDSLIMVGGGVTGSEFVYLFNRVGSRVTWLVDQYGVLPRSDRDIAAGLVSVLTDRGVELVDGVATETLISDGTQVTARLTDGRAFNASHAFIAIGRRPDTQELNLETTGVETAQNGAILTNGFQQSSVLHIYAIGDATGAPMTANRAMAQGRIAARHAHQQPVLAYRAETVVETVYSEPQVAQVGLTEEGARQAEQPFEMVRVGFAANLKAQLSNDTRGLLKLLYEPGGGRLLGGATVGGHAADLMAPLASALERRASIRELASVYAGYPTLSELVFEAARSA